MNVAGADLSPVCSRKPSADFCCRRSLEKLNPVSLWTWAREKLVVGNLCVLGQLLPQHWCGIADKYKALGQLHWNVFHIVLGFYIKLFEMRV